MTLNLPLGYETLRIYCAEFFNYREYRRKDKKMSTERKTNMMTDVEKLTKEIAIYLAGLMSDNFYRLMLSFDRETVLGIAYTLDELKAKDAVHVLKLLFSIGDMEEEGHPLEILDLCKMHNKDIYDIFMDLFRDNVAEDWNFGDDWLDDEEDDYE